jgi:hypothetical protein
VCDACRTVPISHLSLDASEPVAGWLAFFAERGVELVEDDLGRAGVPRRVLGELLTEQRERDHGWPSTWRGRLRLAGRPLQPASRTERA